MCVLCSRFGLIAITRIEVKRQTYWRRRHWLLSGAHSLSVWGYYFTPPELPPREELLQQIFQRNKTEDKLWYTAARVETAVVQWHRPALVGDIFTFNIFFGTVVVYPNFDLHGSQLYRAAPAARGKHSERWTNRAACTACNGSAESAALHYSAKVHSQ